MLLGKSSSEEHLPMLKIDFSEIMERADLEYLLRLFIERKEQIYSLLLERLRQEGPTPYIDFVANQLEGQERTRRYLDAFEQALRGNLTFFFNDQKAIGYKRAIEGYRLEDVFTHKIIFKQVILEQLTAGNGSNPNQKSLPNINNIIFLDLFIDYSNYLLSYSFLRTRDEIITRRKKQIQQLHLYAARIISVFEEMSLRSYVLEGVFNIFGLNSFFWSSLKDGIGQERNKRYEKILNKIPLEVLDDSADLVVRNGKAQALSDMREPISFDGEIQSEYFTAIVMPINTNTRYFNDALIIHKEGDKFYFNRHDRNVLYQFCYLTRSVMANCMMVLELAEKQRELHKVAGELFSIKEEKDKKIAAEIHDIITQALTAIGYKALLCQKLVDKDPARLVGELNLLTESINEALRQSRGIISNLRPRILDDLGMVPAFKNLIANLKKDRNLEIYFKHPEEDIKLDPKTSISLFRILQEALQNIKHHAEASEVHILMDVDKTHNQLSLRIRDNGKGFSGDSVSTESGFGLLIMRERAEDLGGKLEVTSNHEEGCALQVTVPLAFTH
jgi:signal transduction histidine kinase